MANRLFKRKRSPLDTLIVLHDDNKHLYYHIEGRMFDLVDLLSSAMRKYPEFKRAVKLAAHMHEFM